MMKVDNLTDKQIIDHIMNGNNDEMKESLQLALNGIWGIKADKNQTIKLAKQALKENKTLHCTFVDGESCDETNAQDSYLKLWIE